MPQAKAKKKIPEKLVEIKRKLTDLERFSLKVTRWAGSTDSLVFHTIFFSFMFMLLFLGIAFDTILLVLTTIVSLEAIYFSIFIQMSVNRQSRRLREVSKDIEEIQEDVEEIQEDVEEIHEDVEEIQKDVDEIQEDVEEIHDDVVEIQKDVDEIQGDVEELEEDFDDLSKEEIVSKTETDKFAKIEQTLELLMKEISDLKKK